MFASFFFLGRRLLEHGMDFSLLGSPIIIGGLIFIALIEGVGIILASINYHAIIKNVSGIHADRLMSMFVYTVSNLYKYIPGGVLYVVGRNRIAVETNGLSHTKVAFATVVEGVIYAIGAVLVAVIFSFESFFVFTNDLDIFNEVIIVLIIVCVAVSFAAYYFRDKIKPVMQKFWSTVELLKPAVIVKRLAFALGLMFVWSSTFVATMALLGQAMTLSLALALVGLYLLAWLAGFLTPGAPSGLGIREAIMIMFISGVVNESILLSAMVMHRVVTVFGDIFAYVICAGAAKYAQSNLQIK